MKTRLLVSLFVITLTLAGVTSATFAYFSRGQVLAANTFSVGSVNLNGFNYANLNLTNLMPGVPMTVPNFGIDYTGSLNADLYVGARGTSAPGSAAYFADKLYLKVYLQGTTTLVWQGYVNALSTGWKQIATNTPAGWKAYDLEFTLDSNFPNDRQGATNTDTEILVYAVQTGSPAPTTPPWQTTGTDWQ